VSVQMTGTPHTVASSTTVIPDACKFGFIAKSDNVGPLIKRHQFIVRASDRQPRHSSAAYQYPGNLPRDPGAAHSGPNP